ncbi:hypothetical protein GCM10027088_74630 [Nocardia goodfellowii]
MPPSWVFKTTPGPGTQSGGGLENREPANEKDGGKAEPAGGYLFGGWITPWAIYWISPWITYRITPWTQPLR